MPGYCTIRGDVLDYDRRVESLSSDAYRLFMLTLDSPARELEARAKSAGLLLIDEVGGPGADRPRKRERDVAEIGHNHQGKVADRPRKRERDAFFRIINHRADHKRPIVITTNLPPAELAGVFKDPYDRTIARLIKGDGVLVEGKSFRLIEAEGRW